MIYTKFDSLPVTQHANPIIPQLFGTKLTAPNDVFALVSPYHSASLQSAVNVPCALKLFSKAIRDKIVSNAENLQAFVSYA